MADGFSSEMFEDSLDRCHRARRRRRQRGRRAHRRGGPAAPAAERVHRPDAGARPAVPGAGGRPRRGTPPDHVLLSGPPGLGKTTLAMLIGTELERPIRITSGPGHPARGRPRRRPVLADGGRGAVPRRDPPDVALGRGDALPRDGGLPGRRHRRQGSGRDRDPARAARRSPSWGPRPGPGCCRRRCATGSASPATSTSTPPTSWSRSSSGRPGCSRSSADTDGITEIARRSRGTPRIANRLLRRVRDWAQVHGRQVVDEEAAHAALALFDVDDRGLDRLDRAVLDSLCRRFGGGPVGLSTLAVAVGEEADTVETVAEPFLVREGFITRTPRGRAATAAGLAAPRARRPPARLTRPSPASRSTPARGASAADPARGAARGIPVSSGPQRSQLERSPVGHVGRYAVRHLHSGGPPAVVG